MRNNVILAVALTLAPLPALAQAYNAQAPVVPQSQPIPPAVGMNPNPSSAPKANMLPVARNGEVIDSVGSGAIPPALTPEKNQNGVRYLSGGVGDEELGVLKAQEKDYNVHLLLSAVSGEYMSGVSLRFTDSKGAEILKVERAGPYFYAALPPGAYTVEAVSATGIAKTTKVNASEKTDTGKVVIRF